jgi:aminoglycoside phosphotransferase (APT) family kinase protein
MTDEELIRAAAAMVPGETGLAFTVIQRGQFHDVVTVGRRFVVRFARRPEAARLLPQRVELLRRLVDLDLPFATPEPLTDITEIDGTTAVALSWVGGSTAPRGSGDPGRLRWLLDTLQAVDVDAISEVLDVPHAYAGRERWYDLMTEDVIPRLDAAVRDEARRRIDAAQRLQPVQTSLVHGDLAGANVRWSDDGDVIGVIDWDLASASDPAIDAACLAWHGWDNVRAAVDAETYQRARAWAATFAVEQVGAAISNGEPDNVVESYVDRVNQRLRGELAADGTLGG